MAHYYKLLTGLPDLSIDTPKLPLSQEEFYLELLDELSRKDLELVDWLRLDRLNKELIRLIQQGVITPAEDEQPEDIDREEEEREISDELDSQTLPIQELCQIATQAHRDQPYKRSELVPGYAVHFLNELFFRPRRNEEEAENQPLEEESPSALTSLEDKLSSKYYNAGMRSKNAFLAQWFKFNYILRNILVIYTCRKLGWDAKDYVVGNNELAEQLLNSKAKDFDLSEDFPWVNQALVIAEERDISKRERMIDLLRWNWLEEQSFAHFFDIESVLTYYIKLGIIERWLKLDPQTGEEIFRHIVMGLKRESNASLQAFKEKTYKH